MISSTDVMRRLRITKATLYKWMAKGKIHSHNYEIGFRTHYGFDEEEIKRIKSIMVRRRVRGKPLLKTNGTGKLSVSELLE